MKKICFLLLMMLVFSAAHAQRKTSLDQGWKFHRGDVVNGEAIDFNDTRWRTLTVPHDFSMEPAFIPSNGRQRIAEADVCQARTIIEGKLAQRGY